MSQTRSSRRTSRWRSCSRRSIAAKRRALIDPNRAIVGEAPFDPRQSAPTSAGVAAYGLPHVGDRQPYDPDKVINLTTYLAVVDKDYNMVSIVCSPERLRERTRRRGHGRDAERPHEFTLPRPERRQFLQPMKRVRQTINPRSRSRTASPTSSGLGADTQPQTQLQFFPERRRIRQDRPAGARGAFCVISNSFRDSYHPHAVAGKLRHRRCCRPM
ncbi:MAG: hypothetical protein U0Q12_00660 [Vicinamibacterales bacterium]